LTNEQLQQSYVSQNNIWPKRGRLDKLGGTAEKYFRPNAIFALGFFVFKGEKYENSRN